MRNVQHSLQHPLLFKQQHPNRFGAPSKRPSRSKTPQLLFVISVIATATILLNLAHTRLSSGCRSLAGVPARLESNLLEGFYHLRYDAEVLRGQRDRLLNISFANVPLTDQQLDDAHAGTAKPPLFLFIGVFSEGPAIAKRDAVRAAWCSAAHRQASAVCRCGLSSFFPLFCPRFDLVCCDIVCLLPPVCCYIDALH